MATSPMIAMLGHVMVRSFWFVMHNSLEISTPPAGRKPLSFRKRLAFSLVVCGILYLAMELASYGILIYWGESWSRVLQRMKATATRDPLSPMGEYALPVMVHPYIGYVFQPSHGDPNQMVNEKFHITDYGYVDDQPPIRRRSVDKVIVAIVGGSVARQMFMTAANVLEDELSQHPALAGKKFTFVRLAIDGHKQPQQLMTIGYLLTQSAEFDIVINLDGVNEAALPESDNVSVGVAAAYPRNWGNLLGPSKKQTLSRQVGYITYLRIGQRDTAQFFLRRFPHWSPLAQLVWKVNEQRANDRVHQELMKLASMTDDKSLPQNGPAESFESREALYERCVDTWAKSSELLAKLCQSQGIRYYHFLQPNQYVPDSKVISADEKSYAINDRSPFRIPVASCFPKMRQRGTQLRRVGVMFNDMTNVFVDHPATIYKDDCCHLNVAGDAILARAIGRKIRESWDESKLELSPEMTEPNRDP